MKKNLFNKIVFTLLCLFFTFNVNAQNDSIKNHYLQISPRIGYDILPMYKNNTPYIDYKGGIEFGISIDYYWRKFGVGIDYDHIKNKPESTYPTDNLSSFGGAPITNFNLSEASITRTFIGIGPNYQYLSPNNKFTAELNTRVGVSSIKGGRTLLSAVTPSVPLNFHAGYDIKNSLSFKTQLRLNYFFNQNKSLGAHFGVYYLKHTKVLEKSEGGVSAMYRNFIEDHGNLMINNSTEERTDACECSISSIGIFAGLTYRIFPKSKECPICGTNHTPKCCNTCGCSITVTAKDKFTGQKLPNTDVVLVDDNGNITNTGTTNNYGVVVFENVNPNNYTIKGKLHNIDLLENLISKAEFKDCLKDNKNIQKEIIYADLNFILRGEVVECNTTNKIQGVDVILKGKDNATQKNTLSDADGKFIFHLKQASNFYLRGFKNGYFSNSVEVSTNEYDRNKTLFIDFEMCVDPCGEAIRLDNINFDLAKWDILPESIPDLQRVVKLMKDNPNIKVEMSSHTDSRGSKKYNQDLSQKRAQATVNYLISQGIDINRLFPRGAGENELLNKCADDIPCAEEEHRINRRTEFKVLCTE
jgi:outer membrane protein OmpA-like peptidoglycan-associated protein